MNNSIEKVANALFSIDRDISLSKENISKIALLLLESNEFMKKAENMNEGLIESNKRISEELEDLKKSLYNKDREEKISKLIKQLLACGLISASKQKEKEEELAKASDESIEELYAMTKDLIKPVEKSASEFSTLDFLDMAVNKKAEPDTSGENKKDGLLKAFSS